MQTFIGVDVGGTLLRAACYDPDLNLLKRYEQPSQAERGDEVVMQRIYETIRRVMPQPPHTLAGIGVAIPGPLDPAAGVIFATPNLPLKDGTPVARLIEQNVGGPAFIRNDADMAALAEHQMGAGRGVHNMVYITVSTGVGGGLILDGKPYSGRGQGGEIGHMVVLPDGPLCGCGKRGHLEALSSGTGIVRAARERLATGEASAITEIVGGDLTQITAKIVGQAAERGDELARDIITDAGHYLGVSISALMVLLNPDRFVIGGGVSKLGDLLFEPMHDAIKQYTMHPRYWQNTGIVRAELGDEVGLVGAAAFVRSITGT